MIYAVAAALIILCGTAIWVWRSGRNAGRAAERAETAEKTNDVQREMLDAAANRPRDRDDLAERLRRAGL